MSGTADERWLLGLSHRTLYSVQGRNDEKAQATLTMARSTLISVIIQETTFIDEIGKGSIVIDGDATALLTIFGNLDAFPNSFNIVEP